MDAECVTNAEERSFAPDQMSHECRLNHIRMVAYVLADCDELHRAGHMDPGTFGAIVALAVCRLEQIVTEYPLNAD